MAAFDAMAEPDGFYPAIFVAGPGDNGHGVCIIEQHRPGCRNLSDILAEAQRCSNPALAIHDTAGAECVAYALVNAVFERDIDIGFECLKTSNAYYAENIISPLERLATIGGCCKGGAATIGFYVACNQSAHHVDVLFAYVGIGDFDIIELGNS